MKPDELNVENLVPHAGNMVLIDQLLSADDDSAVAAVSVSNEGLFMGAPNSIPAWVGIEYMAQTIAAWAGYHAHLKSEPVRLGFLIGSRKYTSEVERFSAGSDLKIKIHKNFQDSNGLASFDCSITDESDSIVVSAVINVYQPDDEQIKEMMENK